MEQDRMSGLMVCGDLFLSVRDQLGTLLSANADLYEGAVNVLLTNIRTTTLCCADCSLIDQILQICTGKSGRCLCNLL